MKRLLLALFASTAFAAPVPVVNPMGPYTVLSCTPVPLQTTVYSNAYDMAGSDYQGGQITCTGSSVHVSLQLQGGMSPDTTAFAPGAGCVDYRGTGLANVRYDFIAMPFSRIAVTGMSDNGPDTVCTVKYQIVKPTAGP